jgi:hypothetical protein
MNIVDINLIFGWSLLVLAWSIGHIISKRETREYEKMKSKYANIDPFDIQKQREYDNEFNNHRSKVFGPFGSHAVRLLFTSMAAGVFLTNTIFVILS